MVSVDIYLHCLKKKGYGDMPKARDLTGQKFGKLTVLEFAGSRRTSGGEAKRTWLCLCDCGENTIVDTGNLVRDSKSTRSCGCFAIETRTTHGMHESRIYQIWGDMKARCDNQDHKSYHRYGGRGISYQNSWKEFSGFVKDMEEGYCENLTLERIDPNKGYFKENCKWTTKTKQARNRTKSGKNKSGVTGVHLWVDRKNGSIYYVASANSLDGKLMNKHYGVNKYGEELAFFLACEHRDIMIQKLNLAGAGYGIKHGE